MISIVSTCKHWGESELIDRHQAIAIQSWLALSDDIIMYHDNCPSMDAAVRVPGLYHMLTPSLRNESRLATLDGIWHHAAVFSKYDLVMYTNADIVFSPQLAQAVSFVRGLYPRQPFLATGSRIDLEDTRPFAQAYLQHDRPGWTEALDQHLCEHGVPHPPVGADYFIWPRMFEWKMKPFLVGRPRWDNWLLGQAQVRGVPLIDLSQVVDAVHLNHPDNEGRRAMQENLPDFAYNERLARDKTFQGWATLANCTHRLLEPNDGDYRLERLKAHSDGKT